MKKSINLIGWLSMSLISCVLAGQILLLYHVNKVEINKFRQNVSFILANNYEKYCHDEFTFIMTTYGFRCYLDNRGKIFSWGITGDMRNMKLSPQQQYNQILPLVTYDFLHKNQLLDLQGIISSYKKKLQEKGIFESPVLLLLDEKTKDVLITTDSLYLVKGKVLTVPINLGYDYKHQLVAIFHEPSIFSEMSWYLIGGGVTFFLCFIFCVIWQWRKMKTMHHSAEVQTIGTAHLEHELKMPIPDMLMSINDIVDRKNLEFTEMDKQKLKIMKLYLLKMSDVINTMLTALKSSRLKIIRTTIDVQQEMDLIVKMYASIKSSAKVEFHIEKGAEKALLDKVYFNCLLINLVDNAIKYSINSPEVKIWFGQKEEYWELKVTDNGVGISKKDKKRIFQQFYRVKNKQNIKTTGFGLGLVFVQKVANAYGGKILVDSELGKGSQFTFKFR